MARTRPTDRISSLLRAAQRVFSSKGFRRAQMADIAHAMGVSPGSLYNYVESKEALFYLVIDRSFALRAAEPPTLPVPTPPPGALVKRIVEIFRKEGAIPILAAALRHTRADDPRAELEAIVREFYGNVYRTAHVTVILERSAHDLPELTELFYGTIRNAVVSMLTSLINSRIEAGQYRRVPHPAVAARLIIETVTWFARNRRGDPAPQDITDEAAEETTVDFIVNSLVAARSRPRLIRRETPTALPASPRAIRHEKSGSEPRS